MAAGRQRGLCRVSACPRQEVELVRSPVLAYAGGPGHFHRRVRGLITLGAMRATCAGVGSGGSGGCWRGRRWRLWRGRHLRSRRAGGCGMSGLVGMRRRCGLRGGMGTRPRTA